MDLVFGYLAGLLTLINPCVLPVLPIVLATALQASPLGPAALAAGLSVSFVTLGVTISAIGPALGLTPETISDVGAVLMVGFGAVLMVPRFGAVFATASGSLARVADSGFDHIDRSGLRGQFLGGLLLGAVWSPCIGPTLGGAIALASQGQQLVWATAIMIAFAAGVSSVVLALGYGARGLFQRNRALMQRIAERSGPVLGGVFIAVGLAILFRLHHLAEIWAIQTLPAWLIDFSVSL